MRVVFIVLIIFGFAIVSHGQDSLSTGSATPDPVKTFATPTEGLSIPSTENLQQYQKTKIPVRTFDPAEWEKIAGKTDFSEKEDNDPVSEPWITFNPTFSAGIRYFLWAIVIGVVCLVVYLILKNITWDRRLPNAELLPTDITQGAEDINALDLTALLHAAIEARDYRVAIRIYYLMILHQLNITGKIVWKKDKTNREYLAELFAKEYFFSEVRHLTIIYEQVWYGEHLIDATSFDKLRSVFENVRQQIPAA